MRPHEPLCSLGVVSADGCDDLAMLTQGRVSATMAQRQQTEAMHLIAELRHDLRQPAISGQADDADVQLDRGVVGSPQSSSLNVSQGILVVGFEGLQIFGRGQLCRHETGEMDCSLI